MSEELEMWLRLGVPDADWAEWYDFSDMVDRVGSKWQQVKMTIINEQRRILNTMNGVVNFVETIMQVTGASLGSMGDALVKVIGVVIQSALAMQYAYAAGGPVGWAMMLISALALGFALRAEMAAVVGMKAAEEDARRSVQVLNSLKGIIGPWSPRWWRQL